MCAMREHSTPEWRETTNWSHIPHLLLNKCKFVGGGFGGGGGVVEQSFMLYCYYIISSWIWEFWSILTEITEFWDTEGLLMLHEWTSFCIWRCKLGQIRSECCPVCTVDSIYAYFPFNSFYLFHDKVKSTVLLRPVSDYQRDKRHVFLLMMWNDSDH